MNIITHNSKSAEQTLHKTLVLGLGNDLLSDDSIGLRLATALQPRFAAHPTIMVTQTTEMGLALLDLVEGFETVVLVDAIQTGHASPGFVHEFDGCELKVLPDAAPHFLGVGEMLALGQELGLIVPGRVQVFAIEVLDPFTVSTRLSPALEAVFPGILDELSRRLLRFLGLENHPQGQL